MHKTKANWTYEVWVVCLQSWVVPQRSLEGGAVMARGDLNQANGSMHFHNCSKSFENVSYRKHFGFKNEI